MSRHDILAGRRSIPTLYRGTLFRSRLEARWAATFDKLGWYWEYEPDAVDIQGTRYLCDYYLPAQHCWVEVKGPANDRLDKVHHLRRVLPTTDLLVIARPAGPRNACNFHAPSGYGVTIEHCTACATWCFYDYWHDRHNGGDGWTCRTCGAEDALQRSDSYLPSVKLEQLTKREPALVAAFWPTTGGLLELEWVTNRSR